MEQANENNKCLQRENIDLKQTIRDMMNEVCNKKSSCDSMSSCETLGDNEGFVQESRHTEYKTRLKIQNSDLNDVLKNIDQNLHTYYFKYNF